MPGPALRTQRRKHAKKCRLKKSMCSWNARNRNERLSGMSHFHIAYILNSPMKKQYSGVLRGGSDVTVLRLHSGFDECVRPSSGNPRTGYKDMWDLGLKTNGFATCYKRIRLQ